MKILAIMLLAAVPIAAQTQTSARKTAATTTAKTRIPSRAPDGRPDLQGIWTNSTLTPLQRPKGFENRAFFTEAEAPAFQKAVFDEVLALLGDLAVKTSGELGEVWNETGTLVPDRRTALIVDPPNGKIPTLLPEARRRLDAAIERNKQHPADGPEDRNAAERCLIWENQAAPPMLPPPYNPHIQIAQTHEYVVILTEMLHDARVIPLDGRPHLRPTMRQWKGDSRGRWEGDTLVVETTNFAAKGAYSRFDALAGSDGALRVIERFTRIDADTILYKFTVDDPTAYTKAWSAEMPLNRTDQPIFEFACHEGNYSMLGMLRGARAEEKAAEEESAKKPSK